MPAVARSKLRPDDEAPVLSKRTSSYAFGSGSAALIPIWRLAEVAKGRDLLGAKPRKSRIVERRDQHVAEFWLTFVRILLVCCSRPFSWNSTWLPRLVAQP